MESETEITVRPAGLRMWLIESWLCVQNFERRPLCG